MALGVFELEDRQRWAAGGAESPDAAEERSRGRDKAEPAPAANRRCHILLVEDDVSIAELYATVLKINGHTVTHAADGLAGLEAIRSGRFDLILLDIRMPGMDGLAMLRAVTAEQAVANTPVVIVTNYDDPLLRKEAAELGAKDYLLKSRVMPQEIAAQVSKWCP